jgi:hypothetical protein
VTVTVSCAKGTGGLKLRESATPPPN